MSHGPWPAVSWSEASAVGIETESLGECLLEELAVPWIIGYALGKRDPLVEKLVLGS